MHSTTFVLCRFFYYFFLNAFLPQVVVAVLESLGLRDDEFKLSFGAATTLKTTEYGAGVCVCVHVCMCVCACAVQVCETSPI